MKTIKFISLIALVTLSFTGCSSKSTLVAGQPIEEFSDYYSLPSKSGISTFTNVKGEPLTDTDTIIKISHVVEGKEAAPGEIVYNMIDDVIVEAEKRNYRYFQIIYPLNISNLNGFLIVDKISLNAYLSPQGSMVGYHGKTSLKQQTSQTVVDIPLTIFQDSTSEIIFRLVKDEEVTFDLIVWDSKHPRNL